MSGEESGYTSPQEHNLPTDRYWAADKGDELIKHIRAKRRDYYHALVESGLQAKISRNYDYVHGNFQGTTGTDAGKMAIKQVEDSGNALMSVNEIRSLTSQLSILVTENPPAWNSLAIENSHTAIQQTMLSNDVLSFEMEGPHHVEEHVRQTVFDALTFTGAYNWVFWDYEKGKEVTADLGTGAEYREGDLCIKNPDFYSVLYPWEMPWRDKDWVCVWEKVNKWDLIAQHPEHRKEILEASKESDHDDPRTHFAFRDIRQSGNDLVEKGYFYHLKRPSLPYGRRVCFVSGAVLEDTLQGHAGAPGSVWGMEEDQAPTASVWSGDKGQASAEDQGQGGQEPPGWDLALPVHRLIPSRYLFSSFGYSVCFDLQAPNEALNAELCYLLNNHKNFAQIRVWSEIGDDPNVEVFDMPGSTLVQSKTMPQAMQLCQPLPEAFEFIALLRSIMEAISGINAVARGDASALGKAPAGVSLALVDQKAQQAASELIANYYQLLTDVGTAILEIYKKHADSPRVLAVVGADSRTSIQDWTKDDIRLVERVAVKAANPLARTVSGRFELAKFLADNQYVKSTAEIMTVLNTGNYRPMVKGELAELRILHEENERLSRGQPVRVSPLDNHALHLVENHSVLDSTELRQDPKVGGGVSTHLMQHIQMLKDPGIQELQIALGYQIPPNLLIPPPMPGAGAPGGPPPAAGAPSPDQLQALLSGGMNGNGRHPSGGPPPQGLSGALEPTGRAPSEVPAAPMVAPEVGGKLKDARMKGRMAMRGR